MKSTVQIRTTDVKLVLSTSLNLLMLQTRKALSMNIQPMISRFSFCLLAWCTLAVAPAFAQTITHEPLFNFNIDLLKDLTCLLYTSPSPRDQRGSRMPSSA